MRLMLEERGYRDARSEAYANAGNDISHWVDTGPVSAGDAEAVCCGFLKERKIETDTSSLLPFSRCFGTCRFGTRVDWILLCPDRGPCAPARPQINICTESVQRGGYRVVETDLTDHSLVLSRIILTLVE